MNYIEYMSGGGATVDIPMKEYIIKRDSTKEQAPRVFRLPNLKWIFQNEFGQKNQSTNAANSTVVSNSNESVNSNTNNRDVNISKQFPNYGYFISLAGALPYLGFTLASKQSH